MRFTLLWVVPEHELGKIGEMQQSARRLQLPLHPAELVTAVGPCVPESADRRGAEELIRPLTPMMSQGRGSLLG
jgi:hypothetical protein